MVEAAEHEAPPFDGEELAVRRNPSVHQTEPACATSTAPFLGIGTLLRNGIADPITGTYDLPLIAAIFFVVAAFTIFVTFVVDVLYAWLDPRVRIA